MHSIKWTRLLSAIASIGLVAATTSLLAAPLPTVSVNAPAEVPLGEDFALTLSMSNGSVTVTDVGYGPVIDLVLPLNGADGASGTALADGIDFSSASYLGSPVTAKSFLFPDDDGAGPGTTGCVDHPYYLDTAQAPLQVCGTAGDRLVVLELPFGSLVTDQPVIEITVQAHLSELADLGTPLTLQTRGGFQFGADPLGNPCCDPTILDPASSDSSSWPVTASVTPTLFTLTKNYSGPEDETATGPNFPRRYTITLDIADGQTLTDLDVTDLLPVNEAYLSLVSTTPSGAGVTLLETPVIGAPATPPNNKLTVNFASVTGTTGSSDVAVTFEYFVPRLDANGAEVNPAANGDDATALNNASALGDWAPVDGRDTGGTDNASADAAGPEHTLVPKSIAVQKGVTVATDQGGAGPSPGDTLEYRVEVQLSDYFVFTDVTLADRISDGQHFDTTFTPTLLVSEQGVPSAGDMSPANFTVTPNYTGADADPAPNDGTTTISFRLSDELLLRGLDREMMGGCVPTGGGAPDCSLFNGGATTATLIFRTVIQEDFTDDFPSGDPSVDHGDHLNNDVTVTGDLLDTTTLVSLGTQEDDAGTTTVAIALGSLQKTIYAINGSTTLPSEISPGDEVTYRLQYTLPSSDFENLSLVDYLPLPVFLATEVATFDDTVDATVPAAGHAKFGPLDSFRALAGAGPGIPALSSVVNANSLTFDYGSFDHQASTSSEIDLLFTVTVSDQPFADGLFLTNQVRAGENSTNAGAQVTDAINQITLREPFLVITKGVTGSDNPAGIFTPADTGEPAPTPGSPIGSDAIAIAPYDSDLSGVDGGDLIDFTLTLENTGGSGAFDIVVKDNKPTGLVIPAGGLNLSMVRGDGTPVTWSGADADLFSSGLELTDPGGAPVCQQTHPSDGSNIIFVRYRLEVANATAVPESILSNSGTVTRFAGVEGGTNHVDDPVDFADDSQLTLAKPQLQKSISAITPGYAGNLSEAQIGEVITYQVVMTVPEGVSHNVTLVDLLDDGLAFTDLVSITPSSGALSTDVGGGFAGVISSAVFAASGVGAHQLDRQLTLDFGTLSNSDSDNGTTETLTITYRTRLLNWDQNDRGDTRNNQAAWSWDNPLGGRSSVAGSAPNITVTEPGMQLAKGFSLVSGAQWDAGDRVLVTLDIQHSAGSDADAFDVTLEDILPAGISFAGALSSSGLAPDTGPLEAAGSITAGWNSFPQGGSAQITFEVTLDDTLTPTQLVTNSAALKWQSLQASDQGGLPATPNNTLGVERTGNPADTGGAANDYATQDAASLTLDDAAVVKVIQSVSPNGAPGFITSGDLVTYRITVTLPEGSVAGLTLSDRLPAGLSFQNATLDSSGFNGAVSLASATGDGNVGSGETVAITFGATTTTASDNVPGNNSFFIDLVARVEGAQVANDGLPVAQAKLNSVTLDYTGNGGTLQDSASTSFVEPALEISKSMSPANGADAGDTVTITLTVRNSGTAPAYDILVSDTLNDAGALFDTTALTSVNEGTTAAGFSYGYSEPTVSYSGSVLAAGASVDLVFTARVLNGVVTGSSYSNSADVIGDSQSGVVTAERSTSNSGSGSLTIGSPTLSKQVFTTSESSTGTGEHTAANDLTIGELATYRITAVIPEGTTSSVVVIDTLPFTNGVLELVSSRVISIGGNSTPGVSSGGNLTTAGSLAVGDACVATDDQLGDGFDETATCDFGQVTNTPDGVEDVNDQIVIEVVARLLDDASNSDGDLLTNSALVRYGPGLNNSASVDIDVVEPLLVIDKSGDTASGDAGDVITYTVQVQHAGGSSADAFDLSVTDLIPAGMSYVVGSLTDTGTLAATSLSEAAGTLTAVWDSFPQGSAGEFTFRAELLPSVVPGSSVVNTANIVWDSLPADGGQDERSGSDSDGHTVLISQPGVSKVVSATSEPSTGSTVNGPEDDLTIGERVTYRFTFALPEGTNPAVKAIDQLPVGTSILSIVSSQIVSIGGNLTDANGSDGINLPSAGDSATLSDSNFDTFLDHAEWLLGDILNTPDGLVNSDDEIVFEVIAVVVDQPLNQGGVDDQVNTATLDLGGLMVSDTAAVDIVEPELRITKSITDPASGFADAGDTVTVQLLIEHLGVSNADAFNLQLTDTLPDPGLSWIDDATVSGSCSGITVDSSADPVIQFSVATLAQAAGSCTISYQLEVDLLVQPGNTYTNSAALTWDSTPVFVSGQTRRESGSDSADLVIDGPALVKIAASSSLTDTGSAFHNGSDFDLAIGERVTYQLTVTFPEGTTDSAVVTDDMPADSSGVIEVIGASVASLGGNISSSLPGTPAFNDINLVDGINDQVQLDFGTVTNTPDGVTDDNDRIVINVVGLVKDLPVNSDGDSLRNTGELTFATGGPLQDTADVDLVEPALAISKSMGPVTNGVVTINLQVNNSGTAPAYDLEIEDQLSHSDWDVASLTPLSIPAGFTLSAIAGPGAGNSTLQIISDAGVAPPASSIEPGETMAFQFTLALNDPANPPASINNTAIVTVTTTLPGNSDPEERDEPDVQGSDTLTFGRLDSTKGVALAPGGDSDGSGTLTPGDTLRYTLVISNTGSADVTGITLTDTPDSHGALLVGSVVTSQGSVVTGNSAGDGSIEVAIGTLNSSASATVTYDVLVDAQLPAGVTSLINQGTISSNELPDLPTDDPSTPTIDDPTVVTLIAAPDLSVSKDDGGISAVAGTDIGYTLGYANSGDRGASGVTLNETVPLYSSFNTAASSAGWSCLPGPGAGSSCQLDLGVVAAGASGTALFVVTVDAALPAAVTTLNNGVTITDDGSNGSDPTPGDNSATDTTPLTASPDLVIDKDDAGAVATPGHTLVYSLSYRNVGSQAATGVAVTETVPANTRFTTVGSSAGWACLPDNSAGSSCSLVLGTLAAGAAGVLQFAVAVDAATPASVTLINNGVSISDDGSNGSDPTPGNNSDTESSPVAREPDLQISKSDQGVTAQPDGLISYQLDYRNNGDLTATTVVIEETVPAQTRFNSAASTPGWSCLPDTTAGSLCSLAIGTLINGQSGSVLFTVAVDGSIPAAVGTIANSTTIDGAETDPIPGNNSATATTPLLAGPDLTLEKFSDGAEVVPNDPLIFILEYRNVGNQGATGVEIEETVPDKTRFDPVASSSGWQCDSGGVAGSSCRYPVGGVAAGGVGQVVFAVIIEGDQYRTNLTIRNDARVFDDGTNGVDPTPDNNYSSATVTTPPPLSIPTLSSVVPLSLLLMLLVWAGDRRRRHR